VEITPLDPHDDAALAAYHAAYHAADVFERPHAAPWQLVEMRADLTKPRTGEAFHPWVGTEDGVVVATGMLVLPLKDNRDLSIVRVWVPPQHRRRGFGSTMLEHLVEEAGLADRHQLVAEVHVPYDAPEDGRGHPDADFAYARGWSFDMCDIVRVLPLPLEDGLLGRLGAEAAPYHQDYELRQFHGRVPDDLVEAFGELVGSLMVEAPSGEVALEHEVLDVERIRADEAVMEAAGRVKYTTVALDGDGTPVAYTELVVPHHDPGAIFQWGTLVAPAHRGHRLGMATKVANLRWVLAEAPERDRVYTMNAEVNDAMIGINVALGFRAVERHVSVHRKLG
jgi:GNAT superfamily N-acetyltransferase